jgi:N-acetylglucosamine-6-sulfatase
MIDMKKKAVAVQSLLAVAGLSAAAPARQPNIVFIMVDDLSPKAVGYQKGFDFLKTPNIDRIAREGAAFNHMLVTTSLCSPSRATMLTGTYAHVHGVRGNEQGDPDPSLPQFPMLLQQAGYKTALIGKWHMAPKDDPRPGFDYWLSFERQGEYFNPCFNENGHRYQAEGYVTDLLTDKAEEFITQTTNQPFCLLLWHKANHVPFEPAPRHQHAFEGVTMEEPPTWEETLADKPRWLRRVQTYRAHLQKWIDSEDQPVPDEIRPEKWSMDHPWVVEWMEHLRCQLAVDEGTGRILDLLERQGILDNTVVLFTADNGFFLGEHRRGDKRVAYEESMHIPFCMRYPSVIHPGTQINELCASIDVAPSLLDFAGVPAAPSMQGRSFLPLLRGDPDVSWRKNFFYEYFQEEFAPGFPTMLGLRTDRYKYIYYPYETTERGDINELYDLRNDPLEDHNLIGNPEMSAIRRDLAKQLDVLMKQYNYTEPTYRYEPPNKQ